MSGQHRSIHSASPPVRRGLSTTVTWFTSPIVLGGLAILLLFCIVVLQSRVAKFSRDMHRLKEDFSTYRRGMKEKARTGFNACTESIESFSSLACQPCCLYVGSCQQNGNQLDAQLLESRWS